MAGLFEELREALNYGRTGREILGRLERRVASFEQVELQTRLNLQERLEKLEVRLNDVEVVHLRTTTAVGLPILQYLPEAPPSAEEEEEKGGTPEAG